MYGHRVLNHFEKMSYFITRSWFHNDLSELSEDELTQIRSEDSGIIWVSEPNTSPKLKRLLANRFYTTGSITRP